MVGFLNDIVTAKRALVYYSKTLEDGTCVCYTGEGVVPSFHVESATMKEAKVKINKLWTAYCRQEELKGD